MLKRWFGFLAILVMGLLVTACNSGGAGPPGGNGDTVNATLLPEGNSIVATADDGTELRLELPPGAVNAPLDVTVTPLAELAGSLVRFTIEPPGIWFQEPVGLSVTLPADDELPGDATLALGPSSGITYLATDRDEGTRRLTTSVQVLGFAPDFALQTVGGDLRPQADDGDQVSATIADCREQLDRAKVNLAALVASNSFESALQLIMGNAALASNCGLEEDVSSWFEELEGVVCARYEDLVVNAQVVAADDYDIFVELIQPLSNWYGQMRMLSVDSCPGEPTLGEIMQQKAQQFIAFYSAEVAGSFESDYEDLLDEVNKVLSLRGRFGLMGLSAEESLLETTVLHPLMDMLRERSYELCSDQDDHYYLSSLLYDIFRTRRVPITPIGPAATSVAGWHPLHNHASYSDAQLHHDLQYCASSMELEVWADPDVPFEVEEQGRELAGGTGPGEAEHSVQSLAPFEGSVIIRGDIAAFRCDQARSISSDTLSFQFETHEMETSDEQGGQLLSTFKELQVAELSDRAGFDAQGLNTGALTLVRESSACDGDYGDHPFDLFDVDLTIDPVPSLTGATASTGSLTAEQSTEVTFTLPYRDDGTNIDRLEVRYQLGGASNSFTFGMDAAEVDGFSEESGSGTFVTPIFVYCSEQGNNPLTVTLSLIDEFEQKSEEASANITVGYGSCGDARLPSSTTISSTAHEADFEVSRVH